MRGGCICSEFSDQKYTAILIFSPWKKTAGASLAPVTEALAGLQTRDTLKSTACSSDRLFLFPPAPNTQSFTICCRLLPTATTWCPHSLLSAFILRSTKVSLSRPFALLSQLPLACEMEFAAGCPIPPPTCIFHSYCRKSFIVSHGFIGMSLNCNVRGALQEAVIAHIKPANTTGGGKKKEEQKLNVKGGMC